MTLETEDKMVHLEQLINAKIQNLTDKYEARFAALEKEAASIVSEDEDERFNEESRRKVQLDFNMRTEDNIQNIIFCLSGIWSANGMRSKTCQIINAQVDEEFAEAL